MSKLCRTLAMLFHVDMIYIFKQTKTMLKNTLLWDDDRNQIEHRTAYLQFHSSCRRYAMFCQFPLRTRVFLHMLYTYQPFSVTQMLKIQPVHVLFRNDAKTFRCGRSLTIAIVVTPCSSFIESFMLLRGGVERNV